MEAKTSRHQEMYYILRPEVIEAYFYLWRTTRDPKYQEWAWEAVQVTPHDCDDSGGCNDDITVSASDAMQMAHYKLTIIIIIIIINIIIIISYTIISFVACTLAR